MHEPRDSADLLKITMVVQMGMELSTLCYETVMFCLSDCTVLALKRAFFLWVAFITTKTFGRQCGLSVFGALHDI